MSLDNFKSLEKRAYDKLANEPAMDPTRAKCLRDALAESVALYKMFEDPYRRNDGKFQQKRAEVCALYFKGFGVF